MIEGGALTPEWTSTGHSVVHGGSGKSTIANIVERELHTQGVHTYMLDGDNVRHGLNRDLVTVSADEIARRIGVSESGGLKPGAAFVAVHSSFPQEQDARALWLSRYAAYAVASGADPDKVTSMKAAVEAHLSLLTPEEDATILREAGFADVDMFYAAFTWRGWVAYA